jgi:hypothetical protein
MNFITYEAAYALYPWATFEERSNLYLKNASAAGETIYAQRGWRTVSAYLLPNDCIPSDFFVDVERSVMDCKSWRMPLDMRGVQFPPPLSATSVVYTSDPSTNNTWIVKDTVSGWSVSPQMAMLKSGVLRYNYTCASLGVRDAWKKYLDEEFAFQWERVRMLPTNDREAAWTWCALASSFRRVIHAE